MSLLLALLLLSPTVDRDAAIATGVMIFGAYADEAAERAAIHRSEIKVGRNDELPLEDPGDVLAWVNLPADWTIWLDEEYAAEVDERSLCLTAYHEVCHQLLRIEKLPDDSDHEHVYGCMRAMLEPEDCR